MIVWTGSGFLIALVGVTTMVFAQLLGNNLSGSETFFQETPWVTLAATLVAAVLTYVLNRTVLKPASKLIVDIETGKEKKLKVRHTLLFVSAKWWPVIFIILGVLLTYMKSIT